MAITSLIVKIGANDESIQKALASIGVKAKSLDADLSKLGNTPVGTAAQKSLEKLESSIKSVTEDYQRMADRGVNAARGLDAVGGAAKLMSGDLDSMKRTIDKGLDAFRALGKDAPADMLRVRKAITDQQDALAGASSSWQSFVRGFDIQRAISDPMGTAKSATLALSESLGGATLAAAAGVAAFAAIGTAAFKLASNAAAVGAGLDDMADKTGMSVPALSRLQNAAKVAGSDLGTLTDAVFKIQVKMGEGGKKWDEAMRSMSLTTEQLRDAGPDHLLQLIAEGLVGIKDPSERAATAQALTGKSAKELMAVLPDLAAAFKLTNDIEPWTAEQAAEAEAFEMQLSSLLIHAEAFGMAIGRWLIGPIGKLIGVTVDVVSWLGKMAGELSGILPLIRGIGSAWEFAGAAIRTFRGQSEDLPKITGDAAKGVEKWKQSVNAMGIVVPDLTAALREEEVVSKDLARSHEEITKAQSKASAEAKRYRDEAAALTSKVKQLEGGLAQVPEALQKIGRGYDESKLAPLAAAVEKVEQNSRIANFGFRGMTDELKNVGIAGEDVVRTAKDIEASFQFTGPVQQQVQTLGQSLKGVLKGVPGMIAAAFTGGGGILGALKGIGSQIGSTLGERIGKALGMTGPIGAAIGSLAGPLIGAFSKLFGSVEKQVNPVREQFVQMAGGLDALNRKAAAAGVTLKAMLDAKTPEAYKKAVDDLNAAFQFQEDALALAMETAKRYGFTIEELGPALQRQELDKQAQQIFKDWTVLNAAGIDTVAITARMAQSVNDYVKQAVKMGVEVPSAMKPMLQAMIDQGLLTDAAGNKIENLEDSGITFAQTMSEGFKSVVDEVKKLAEAITRSLGGAITGLPTHKTINVGFNVDPVQLPSFGGGERFFAKRGGLVTAHGIQQFASGGRVLPFMRRGSDSVPAMLTPGEIILNEAMQGNVAAAIVGGGSGSDDGAAELVRYLRGREATESARLQALIRSTVQTTKRAG